MTKNTREANLVEVASDEAKEACCALTKQTDCCEPADKASCCGSIQEPSSCGCQ